MKIEAAERRADIPAAVAEAIERERRQLQKASAVLTCLWIAPLYAEWHDEEIDASDVALVVRALIDEAINALDLVALAQADPGQDADAEG